MNRKAQMEIGELFSQRFADFVGSQGISDEDWERELMAAADKAFHWACDRHREDNPAGTITALTEQNAELRDLTDDLWHALNFLANSTRWKSVDKDNMEFEGRVTCFQLEKARTALQRGGRDG